MLKKLLIWYLKRKCHWRFDFDKGAFYFVTNRNLREYYSFGFVESLSDTAYEDMGLFAIAFFSFKWSSHDERDIFLTHELK